MSKVSVKTQYALEKKKVIVMRQKIYLCKFKEHSCKSGKTGRVS